MLATRAAGSGGGRALLRQPSDRPRTSPNIKAPLLVHYAEKDERINAGVAGLRGRAQGRRCATRCTSTRAPQHGFNNDTTPRYDEAAAAGVEADGGFLQQHAAHVTLAGRAGRPGPPLAFPRSPVPVPGPRTIAVPPRLNALGQPIGPALDQWRPPQKPPRAVIEGPWARLEPLDPARHAGELFDANALDADARRWTYLPYGPFADFAEYRAWMGSAGRRRSAVLRDRRPRERRSRRRRELPAHRPAAGSIEVGHIHFSPRAAAHAGRDRGDVPDDAARLPSSATAATSGSATRSTRPSRRRGAAPRASRSRASSARPSSTRAATATPRGIRSLDREWPELAPRSSAGSRRQLRRRRPAATPPRGSDGAARG